MKPQLAIACVAACSFDPTAGAIDAPPGNDAPVTVDAPSPDAELLPPGTIARWDFDETGGNVVHDSTASPIDPVIAPEGNTAWAAGALEITGEVRIQAADSTKIVTACATSGAITVEAWVKPADAIQTGPARVFTISANELARNITVAQAGQRWHGRVRTPFTDGNGVPELITEDLIATSPALTHVALTTDDKARTLYVDGVERDRDELGGSFSSWAVGFPITVANEEIAPMRSWRGTIHRIAIYDRALSILEIQALRDAGP